MDTLGATRTLFHSQTQPAAADESVLKVMHAAKQDIEIFHHEGGVTPVPLFDTQIAAMVAGFGDVGWRLQVGEVGVAPFHSRKSPYGWHIIKRVQ